MIDNLEVIAGYPNELKTIDNEYYRYCMYINDRVYHVSEKGLDSFHDFILNIVP